MECSDIRINKMIVHILDSTVGMPVLADVPLEYESGFGDLIRGHLVKILTSDERKKCEFYPDSLVLEWMNQYNQDNFVTSSKQLADRLYGIMNSNLDIPAADLIVVEFSISQKGYLGLLKMNYKPSYTHYTEPHVAGNQNDIILQKAILPSESQKLSEAVIIDLTDYKVQVLEKKYEINGVKENYLSKHFLQCQSKLSQKTKVAIVTKAVEEINQKYYEGEFDKQLEAKSAINQQLEETGSIDLKKVTDELYKERAELKEEFNEKMEKYQIEEVVTVENKQTTRRFEKQHITTDTGIEIKIPMEQYKSGDSVEFITNPDGTISVLLKNVGKIKTR